MGRGNLRTKLVPETSVQAADNTRAILMPSNRALSDVEAKPWRMTMAKVLTHSLVMNTQARPPALPLHLNAPVTRPS